MHSSGAAQVVPSPGTERVALQKLSLSTFRNYSSLRLDLDSRPVTLAGKNGAGKTNLLEAVSLLAPGRGIRNARLEDLPPHDSRANTWAIAATVSTTGGNVDLGTGVTHGNDKRQARIDGQQARGQSNLGDYFAAIWLTPQMDRLFLDGAEERRRFLDRLVAAIDPAHTGRLIAYNNGRRQRQRILADNGDIAWLDALEKSLAQKAVAIAAARLEVAQLLDGSAQHEGPFPVPSVQIFGDAENWLAGQPALSVEDRLVETWRQTRGGDAATGRTSVGVHRTDLIVRDKSRGVAAADCSTGEQKALLIGLTLASAKLINRHRGLRPVLLLDEVAAHLDADRRAALFELLLTSDCQFWLTGTDAALFEPLGDHAQHFIVANGNVTHLNGSVRP